MNKNERISQLGLSLQNGGKFTLATVWSKWNFRHFVKISPADLFFHLFSRFLHQLRLITYILVLWPQNWKLSSASISKWPPKVGMVFIGSPCISLGAAELHLDTYSLPYFRLCFLWDICLQTSKNSRKSMSETQYQNYKKLEKILSILNASEYQCFWLPNMCRNCVMMCFSVLSVHLYIYFFKTQTQCPWKPYLLRYPP